MQYSDYRYSARFLNGDKLEQIVTAPDETLAFTIFYGNISNACKDMIDYRLEEIRVCDEGEEMLIPIEVSSETRILN